jgi:biopolymer transport protein ExbB/TolQ
VIPSALEKVHNRRRELMADFVGFSTVDVVGFGMVFVGVVGVVTLVFTVLALRSAQAAARLAEERNEYLKEEQERLALLHQEHKSLYEELERERQQRKSLQDELDHEHQQRLEAQQKAEWAQQEALKGAAQQLRERIGHYLSELEDKEDTDPGIRRVKRGAGIRSA